MLARMKTGLRSLVTGARAPWSKLGRRRQIALAGAVALLMVAGVSTGLALGWGKGEARVEILDCGKPVCVRVIGPKGGPAHPMTPVRIRAAGVLDREAAVSALRISNQPKGETSFEGEILTFRPQWPGFARGVDYDVALALAPSALPQGAEPVNLSFRFTTEGKLEVSSVFPEDGAREVALDAAVMVQFNRSVAPLTVVEERGPEGIIEFDPPVQGHARWLNTSLYTFEPGGEGWAPATLYSARIEAGLANELGAQLAQDYVFSFSTLSPDVASVFPSDNSSFVAPLPKIRVEFNQPVDQASAEAGFVLVARGSAELIAGTFRWPDGRTMLFRSAQALSLSTTFEATVRAGVRARDSDVATAEDVRWTFTTAGVPKVASTDPADGSRRADRWGVRITFTNPMDEASVEDHIAVSPEPEDDLYFFWEENGRILHAGFPMSSSTPYTVSLSTDAVDRYGQPLTQPLKLDFVTAPVEPSLTINRSSPSGTFNAYLEPKIMVTSWNLERLDFELYRIDREGLIEFERSPDKAYAPPRFSLIRQWRELIAEPPLDKPVITPTALAVNGSRLAEGVYFLRVSGPGARWADEMALVVSSANVTTKWTEEGLLAWIVDMKTGEPLANLPLQVLRRGANAVATGRTDADGVAQIQVPAPPDGDYWSGYYLSGETTDRTVLASTTWDSGIAPWSFDGDILFDFAPPKLAGYLYTDRPIYRPGETVHIKGVVREDDDARYSLAEEPALSLWVRDAQWRLVESQAAKLSDMGTFDAELALSLEVATGEYSAQLVKGSPLPETYPPTIAEVPFRVAEFRKPEFEVSVLTDRDSYVNGDTIKGTVSAELFFGAPLADADVEWQVTAQPHFFQPDDYPGYSFSDCTPHYDLSDGPFYESQQYLRGEGAGRTDSLGRLTFTLPAEVSSDPVSQTFTVEATVTDESQQSVAAFTAVPVHKGEFYLGVKPEACVVSAGEEAKVGLVSLDPDGRTVASVPVTVSVYQRKWHTVRERDPEGEQRYRSEPDDILIQTIDAVTGADGAAQASFRPTSSRQYYLLAEAGDSAGNTIKASAFVWASSPEYASWRIGNDDIIELVADRDEYSPGDTAKVLVAAPFEGSRGIVTQERGRLMSYELRDFATNSDILDVPITSDHIPNVYLGVTLFKPPTPDNPMPQVKFGLVELRVSSEQKKLNITVEPDRDRLGPRDTVTYRIRTTDSEGKGAPAELSLALVDRSVLSLQDDPARPALEAFWHRRPISVLIGSSFAVSIDRANELAVNRQQGGGKGGSGCGDGPGDLTRTFFPNTAYWEPALRTDKDGTATVEVRLPDNLTTWHLTARGVTADTKAGEAANEIVTSKDLIVRPVVPRFLIADDRAFLGAIVHNFTDAALDVDVSLRTWGLDVEGGQTRSVAVAPGGDALLRWGTRARPGRDSATLAFEAEGEGKSDSVRLSLPLYGFLTPETVATAGEVSNEASEAVRVPYYVRPDAGELTVSVSPSLAAGVNTAIDYLKEYPWECTELAVSRLVSVLALRRAVDELGLTDVDGGTTDVTALVQRSLQRLYNYQHDDGGWGWWIDDDSDPAITAYVLIGLAEAKRAGFEIDQQVEDKAIAHLTGELDRPRHVLAPDFDLRAYILYALARDGRGDLGRSFALAEQRASLSNTAKAWAALAIKLSGGSEEDPRLTSLLDDLQTAAIPSATGNHWEEAEYNPDIFGNSVLTTAQVLQAFTEFRPEHPLVDDTLRWLMVARKEGHWESPHDTTVALLAITDFMIARKDVQAPFDYRVELNGETKLEGSTQAGKVHQEDKVVIEMKDLLKDALNELKIARTRASAAGRLYYTAHLRYFTPAEAVEAANHGIGVSHQYSRADVDEETPVTEVRLGDVVKVKVTLVAESNLNFLVLEDYLLAGLDPIDTSLKTTPPDLRRRLYEEQEKSYQISKRYSPFGHTDIRDNRVALFARFVPKGVYEYTYFAQATTPGEFNLPPATAYEQYFPEIWGRSDGGTFVVRRESEAAIGRAVAPSEGATDNAGAAPSTRAAVASAAQPPDALPVPRLGRGGVDYQQAPLRRHWRAPWLST